MTASLIITGRIGRKGELKENNDRKWLSLTIPEDVYLGKDREAKTEWHQVTLWGKDAELADRIARVGSIVETQCSVSYARSEKGFHTYFNVRKIQYIANFGKQAPA